MAAHHTPISLEGSTKSRYQVHVELFSLDEKNLANFLNNHARVNQGKRYLIVAEISNACNKLTVTKRQIIPLRKANSKKDKQDSVWHEVTLYQPKNGATSNSADFDKKKGWIKSSECEQVSQFELAKLGFEVMGEQCDKPLAYADITEYSPYRQKSTHHTFLINCAER